MSKAAINSDHIKPFVVAEGVYRVPEHVFARLVGLPGPEKPPVQPGRPMTLEDCECSVQRICPCLR